MKTIIKALILATCVSALFCACTSGGGAGEPSHNGGKSVLKMGVVLPLTGTHGQAEAASEILAGMRIAQESLNSSGFGAERIELDIRDCAVGNFAYLETIEEMSAKGVKLFHCGLSDLLVSRFKTCDALGDCFFNLMTTYPPATTSAKNTTRIFINGAQEGDLLTEKIVAPAGRRSYVIMNEDSMCGRSNAAYYAFNLGKPDTKCFTDVFGAGEKIFTPFGDQIMRISPDYTFYIGSGAELDAFSKCVADSGYKGVLLANCGTLSFSSVSPRAGLRFGKIRTAFEAGKVKNLQSEKFAKAYLEKFSRQPTWLAAFGFDSVVLFARARAEGYLDAASMRKFFTTKTFECASGKLEFDNCADSVSQLEIAEVK